MQTGSIGRFGERARFGGVVHRRGEEARGERLRGEALRDEARQRRRRRSLERRAKAIGWVGLGLGMVEVIAPGVLVRLVGAREARSEKSAMTSVGVRELVTSLGVLSGQSALWLWARVVGDVMDVALLARASLSRRADHRRLAASMASVASALLVDVVTALQLGRARRGAPRRGKGIHVNTSITVNRPREEVYAIWRDIQNLPVFMDHIESVIVGDRRSRWRAASPDLLVEWEVEIVEDRAGEVVAWRSVDRSNVEAAGTVSFTPARGGRATEITVDLCYGAPSRRVGKVFAKLFGEDPKTELDKDLRRFKQIVETGEVMHSDASIHRGMHAARPPRPEELEAIR